MKMLTLSALFACVLLPQTVVFAADAYKDFADWLISTSETTATSSLKKVCSTKKGLSPTDDCNLAATAAGGENWSTMCDALGKTHPCPGDSDNKAEYTATIQNIHGCCVAVCNDIADIDTLTFASPEACCAACAGPDNGIPKPNPTTDSVGYFLTWASTGIDGSCTAPKPDPEKDCEEASKRGTPANSPSKRETSADGPSTSIGTPDNWTEMCAALADFDCTSSDPSPTKVVDTFSKCCSKTENGGCSDLSTHGTGALQVECCAACITSSETTPAPPSPSDSSHSESGSGDTTEETGETTTAPAPTTAPGPSPTPSSSDSGDDDTTTMGSDSDSAINIGASGLLVTLITMMAAGVNIA